MNEQTNNSTKKNRCCGKWVEKCPFCPLLLAILFFIIGFVLLSLGGWHWRGNGEAVSYKSATYTIEGTSVTFINSVASSTEATTRYFGNEGLGDLNNDGRTDIAFLVTRRTAGTGTFYYVTAALKTDGGYVGTNAVFLGDRIAPQSTQIRTGVIIVNYADRKLTDPMTAAPSIGISRMFKIVNGQLQEVK